MNKEEYTPDIVSIVDEDGKEHIFEELDRIETDSGRYVALLPLPETPDQITEDDNELIILKVEEENGEESDESHQDPKHCRPAPGTQRRRFCAAVLYRFPAV